MRRGIVVSVVVSVVVSLVSVAASAAGSAPPAPVSPGSAVEIESVAGRCPTFTWESAAGAEWLELVVYRLPENGRDDASAASPRIALRLPAGATAWTPPLAECLEPGARYGWSIRAASSEGSGEWPAPSLFRIDPGPSREEVVEAYEVLRRYLEEGEIGDRIPISGPPGTRREGESPEIGILSPISPSGLFDPAQFQVTGTAQADVVRLGDTGANDIFWEMREEVNNDMTINYAAEFVRIGLDGNVGIGTTGSPQEKLEVAGRAQLDVLRLGDTGGNGIFWDIAEDGVNDLIFDYAGQRVIFRNNGNVGIGTVSPPAQKLHVNGVVRLTLDTAAATPVCIDGQGDLSACTVSPSDELEKATRLLEAQQARIERLEAALCAAGVDAALCVGS